MRKHINVTPIVLIATHNRVEITTRNIESLFGQMVSLILLVVSSEAEKQEYQKRFPLGVKIVTHPNNPLGAKWDFGLRKTLLQPNPLIITGSDDILGDGFIENACRLVQAGNHFIGLRRWWQHKDGKAYHCQYLAGHNLPIGGARVYSAEMLKAINYQVFDPTKDRHLDEFGFDNARKSGLKCLVLDDPEKEGLSIHAIKGNWPVMNEFTIRHKNIRLLRTEPGYKVLPNYYGKETSANSNH